MVADSVAAGLVVPSAAAVAVEGPLVASAATNARVSKIHCSSHREVRSAVHPCNRHRGLPARRPVDRRAAWQVLRALLTRERGDLITPQHQGLVTCRAHAPDAAQAICSLHVLSRDLLTSMNLVLLFNTIIQDAGTRSLMIHRDDPTPHRPLKCQVSLQTSRPETTSRDAADSLTALLW